MDGTLPSCVPALDVSAVAGRITSFLARRHASANRQGDVALAARYDANLDTIYYAALLLMIVDGTGATRSRTQVLAALDSVSEVTEDLRDWIGGLVS